MFPQLNVCCVLTVSVCLSSILASPSCQNCLLGKCDQEGVCTDGCEPGFADIFCQHPCQETCTDGRCKVDNSTGTTMCTEGCTDGFCYPACKIPCPEGCLRCKRMLCENCTLCESHLYGENCQHSCLDKCKGYACSIQGNCSQDTCMGGRHGKLCSSSCKPRYESCDKESGHCSKCRRGLFGDDCQNECSQDCLTRKEENMFKCRSGCRLCEIPPHSESKKELDCTDMEAKLNTTYRLCIALIVICVTSTGLLLASLLMKITGRTTGSRQADRNTSRDTGSGQVNRSFEDINRIYRDSRVRTSDEVRGPLLAVQDSCCVQPLRPIQDSRVRTSDEVRAPMLEVQDSRGDQPSRPIQGADSEIQETGFN